MSQLSELANTNEVVGDNFTLVYRWVSRSSKVVRHPVCLAYVFTGILTCSAHIATLFSTLRTLLKLEIILQEMVVTTHTACIISCWFIARILGTFER
jgi:hypothetical protein